MRAPFILYFASAKYRLTVTPSNEIKDTSLSLLPFLRSLSRSLSLSRSRGRESRACGSGEVPATWPTTPLRSLRSRTSYRGLFFLREPLPALRELCFSFSSLPRPPSTVLFLLPLLPRGSSAASFFPFPFSCCSIPGTRSRGIMQHITEKSKQARRNSPGSDCPDPRVAPLSLQRRPSHASLLDRSAEEYRFAGESWLADILGSQ